MLVPKPEPERRPRCVRVHVEPVIPDVPPMIEMRVPAAPIQSLDDAYSKAPGFMMDIADLDDEALEYLAAQWTAALFRKAGERRRARETNANLTKG